MIAQLLWHSPSIAPFAGVGLALLLAAVFWLYLPQIRGMSMWKRWMLVTLRAFAIGAIVAAALQPAILKSKTIAQRGAIVVLVDRSRSMSVIDKRSAAGLVALADALGELAAQTRSPIAPEVQSELAQLRAAADELDRVSSEAEYARLSGRGREAAVQRLADVTAKLTSAAALAASESPKFAASPALAAKLAELRTIPPQLAELRQRITQAQTLLADYAASTDAALYAANPQVKSICDRLATQSRSELVETALRDREHGVLAQLPPGTPIVQFAFAGNLIADNSATTQPNEEILASRTDISGAVRAIQDRLVGRPVQAMIVFSDGRETRASVVGGQRSGAAPIFSVCAASASPTRDVAIVGMTAPYSIFAGESANVSVDVRGTVAPGATVNVSLEAEGATQIKPVALPADSFATVDSAVKFQHSGPQQITARVAALDGEITDANNVSRRWVKVITDKVPVALVAGSPSWDAQHVRTILSQTRWAAPRELSVAGESPPADLTPQQIGEQSVVVLLDVGPAQLDANQWEALTKLVTDRAGSVIVAPGERHGARALQRLARILPFDLPPTFAWRTWRENGRYFRVDETDEASSWPNLAPISRFLALPKLSASARPLVIERETEAPVLVENRAGAGRFFLLGADESWRWRETDAGDEQFWQRLIRYACDEPYAVHQGELRLDADKVAAEPGEAIRVRARASQSPRMNVTRAGQVVKTVSLKQAGGGEQFEASIDDLPRGDYVLQLRGPKDQTAELPLRIAESDEAEMADLSADENVLRRIVASSGGAFLRVDQVNELPRKLAAAREAQNPYIEYPLWDSPYLFLFVVGALGAEWSLRKRLGLA